jgi:hypothetical protein
VGPVGRQSFADVFGCHLAEAGPYQTVPYPGQSGVRASKPKRPAHEYQRQGTAKLLSWFHPADGRLHACGVTCCPKAVLHPGLKQELTTSHLATRYPALPDPTTHRAAWRVWQAYLSQLLTLPEELPPLRMLWVLDNLREHKTPAALVLGLFTHGVMPRYTPLSGSWLNQEPTPFEWGGKRAQRRLRSHQRRHTLGGSGACVYNRGGNALR